MLIILKQNLVIYIEAGMHTHFATVPNTPVIRLQVPRVPLADAVLANASLKFGNTSAKPSGP